ncbi:MAG: phosphohydrolase [Thermodesulfobacteriota bacterium]|nr:phosphohydrolase [Thermodesulfobacteriota bacterium]
MSQDAPFSNPVRQKSGLTRPPDPAGNFPVPTDDDCKRFWDICSVPDHIRDHSIQTALVAETLAVRARKRGLSVCVQSVRASALLHDLAKEYTILHGGKHAQLGGAWTMALTKNPAVAQGVMHHVWWPWEIDPARYFLPLAVLYGDKRAKHAELVSLDVRYEDLFERYGGSPEIKEKIKMSLAQAKAIESALSELLSVSLHACTFAGGRLVE